MISTINKLKKVYAMIIMPQQIVIATTRIVRTGHKRRQKR